MDLAKFDLSDLSIVNSGESWQVYPFIIVIDAQDRLDLAKLCLNCIKKSSFLENIPSLLVVSASKLGAMDFSSGFTDFLLSPFAPAELLARIRQIDWHNADFGSEEIIKIGDLVIDIASHGVHIKGKEIVFTFQEFELLKYLALNRGRAYSRSQLLTHVWGDSYRGSERTVDIHIRRVRAKLSQLYAGLIVTVRSVGYKMN